MNNTAKTKLILEEKYINYFFIDAPKELINADDSRDEIEKLRNDFKFIHAFIQPNISQEAFYTIENYQIYQLELEAIINVLSDLHDSSVEVDKNTSFYKFLNDWSKIAKAPYPFIKTALGFDLYNKYKEKPDEFKYLGRINNILQRYDDASYMAYTHVCNAEFTYNEFLNISYGDKVFKFHNNIDNILDKVKDMQEELKKLSYPEYFKSLENIFIESICKDKDLENTIEMDNDIEERDI